MIGEGCPGHGPLHLLSASAAEMGFRWDPGALAWSRLGIPQLSNLAGPLQHFKAAILDAWRNEVTSDLCRRKGVRGAGRGRGEVLFLTFMMDVLGAMIRYGVSLSRSVELAAQWDRILAAGPLYPVTLVDLSVVRGMGIGAFYHAAYGIHRRLSDFIHAVVVCRRDEAVRGRRNWIREDAMVHHYRWLRPDLVPSAPFRQCKHHLAPGSSQD